MGFFDSLKKVVNDVVDSAGSDVKGKLNESLGEILGGNSVQNNSNYSQPVQNPQSIPTPLSSTTISSKPARECRDVFFDEVNGESIQKVSIFNLSADFVESESHGSEVSALYVFAPTSTESFISDEDTDFDTTPVFGIDCGDDVYKTVEQFKKNGTINGDCLERVGGKMLFKGRIKTHGMLCYMYGFDRGELFINNAISVTYPMSMAGTPLERKLMNILDEAAASYREEIDN